MEEKGRTFTGGTQVCNDTIQKYRRAIESTVMLCLSMQRIVRDTEARKATSYRGMSEIIARAACWLVHGWVPSLKQLVLE